MRCLLIWVFILFVKVIVFCQNKSTVEKVDSLNLLAYVQRYSDPSKALRQAEVAMNISEKEEYKKGTGTSYVVIGTIYLYQGDYKQSNENYQKALKIRSDLRDSNGIASVYVNLGNFYLETGDLLKSLNHYLTAESIYKRLNDQKGLGLAYTNLANLLDDQNEPQEAIAYNEKAQIIQRRLMEDNRTQEDSQNYVNTTYNLAERYFNLRNDDLANKYLAEALPLFKSLGDWEGEALIHYFKGTILHRQGKHNEAEAEFAKSEKIYLESEGEGYSLGIVYLNAYQPKIALGKAKEALAMLRKTRQWLNIEESVNEKHQLSQALAETFHALGQSDSAWFYQQLAIVLNDSIYNSEKSDQYTKWKTKFQTQEKEQELLQEKIVSEQATTRSRTFLTLFLAALAVAAATFFYYRHRQRTAALIAQQQEQLHVKEVEELLRDQEIKSINAVLEGQEGERVRIAKDLHDRLGSMLTTVKWSFDGFMETSAEKQDLAPLAKASGLLDDAYQEVRRISHDMVSGVLTKFGLVPAVEELCSAVNASGKLQAKLVVFGMEERPDNQVEITLYRVIQELMSNILKHAKASNVTIQISRVETELNVTVEDNGQGFDPAAVKSSGMGLKNIEARVRGINGTVFFDTGKGNGTSVMIEVPV